MRGCGSTTQGGAARTHRRTSVGRPSGAWGNSRASTGAQRSGGGCQDMSRPSSARSARPRGSRHDRALIALAHGARSTDPWSSRGAADVDAEEVVMRNEAMEQLDVLIGSWHTTMRNAWFLEPTEQEVPGSASVQWLDDAFVVFRWTMQGDVGPATSEMILVLGRSDAND